MANKDQGRLETWLGLVVIVLLAGGLSYFVWTMYATHFKPAPVNVALSAYFVNDSGAPVSPRAGDYWKSHIKIRGDVDQGGQPLKSGSVRVTVNADDGVFQQSIFLPLNNGHFETDDPAFMALRPGMRTVITAEVTSAKTPATAAIYLNGQPPMDKSGMEYVFFGAVFVMAVVFFYAFTGAKTPAKNQTAIIFSYLVIAVFLAVPILAPVILIHTFPDAVGDMIGAPVGLINVHTANQPDDERQWALNIGGYSYVPRAKKEKSSASAMTGTTPAADASSTTTAAPAGALTSPAAQAPAAPGGSVPKPPAASNPGPAADPTDAASPAASTAAPTDNTAVPEMAGLREFPIVEVQGGLVIPLYVIILSVIGGAINMTRKVPGLQKEGESSDTTFTRPFSRVGGAVLDIGIASRNLMSSMGKPTTSPADAGGGASDKPVAPEITGEVTVSSVTIVEQQVTETRGPAKAGDAAQSLEAQARQLESQLDPLVVEQIRRNCDTDQTLSQIRSLVAQMRVLYKSAKSGEQILKFSSFEDWVASHPRLGEILRGSWRVELLNQYMYLISAPFLAIVTYYILDLLGLSKQGVVVLLSFSVGLISEKIVSWILGIATGYLQNEEAARPRQAPSGYRMNRF